MNDRRVLSRRSFLIVSATAGASVLVGGGIFAYRRLLQRGDEPLAPSTRPDVWVRIDTDNTVTVTVAKSEMGQGVRTSMAMIVAEELDADWSQIRVEQARAHPQYGNQFTGGSESTRQLWAPLRTAAATARQLLVTAAAQTWQVDTTACQTGDGYVVHGATGRRFSYGQLAVAAASLPVPETPPQLKHVADFKLIGTPTARIDNPRVVDGSAVYGLDVRVPGMRYATVARSPVFGGKVASFDATQTKAAAGVLEAVQISTGVAVVGETTWAVMLGRAQLKVTWAEGPNAQLSSESILRDLLAQAQPLELKAPVARTLEAIYTLPYLAHAPMEPMNAVADVRADRCEIWAPTQNPLAARDLVARLLNLPADAVTVNVTLLGGGFGRRLESDYIAEAVEISKAVGAPAQVVWSRDDDMRHDFYRPASQHALRAGLDEAGLPVAWSHNFVTPGISWHVKPWLVASMDLPYTIASVNQDAIIAPQPVPTGTWRSVHRSQTTFASEGFFDELAVAGGVDPLALRLRLAASPRMQRVLAMAAERAGWGGPLPAGSGRGIACLYDYGSFIAQVVELSVADGQIIVRRVVSAADCGIAVNPRTIEAQIEGAVIDGLATALSAEITVQGGQVEQQQLSDYGWLRISAVPRIETYLVPSQEEPGGVGELGYPAIPPAVANAVYAATGKRIRRLPIRLAEAG
ncbi:MAG: xanthine dehydrogenase family protein molybdopterin-binding subunit [Chloroflexales bacterium]|nr:xanthine dehydrogenase family protein molybdopterin-binding subunit [Chloroflexales bacterium]